MLDFFFLPAHSVVTAKGVSDPVDISGAASRVFLLTLSIQSMVEQEAIDVTLFTSPDGTTWDATPAAALAQKFYVGQYPLLVDLRESAQAKFVRAHWEVNRWGRGANTPRFEISLRLREVPRDALGETEARAMVRQ